MTAPPRRPSDVGVALAEPLSPRLALPRFPLAALPTPLVRARRLHGAVGGPPVWVKRDDLTGFATAGNKARSLEYLIGDAVAQGCDVVVTGGGASSNFCAAAAAAARVAGLDCHLVLYGAAPAPAQATHPNLAAAVESGAQVHFTGRSNREEVDAAIPALFASLSAGGRRPYAMPRGGATAVGAAGYVQAWDELQEQAAAVGLQPGLVVVATGSGGTQAGLVAGAAASNRDRRGGRGGDRPAQAQILGATVSRPPVQVRQTVAALAQACGSLLAVPMARPDQIQVVDARGPGFGLASDDGERARRLAWDTEGLVLDPVYTAKAFAALLDLIAGGFRQPVVFWHTGGLPAALHHLSSERSALCPT
jgi:D-cysteine desulfhydrase